MTERPDPPPEAGPETRPPKEAEMLLGAAALALQTAFGEVMDAGRDAGRIVGWGVAFVSVAVLLRVLLPFVGLTLSGDLDRLLETAVEASPDGRDDPVRGRLVELLLSTDDVLFLGLLGLGGLMILGGGLAQYLTVWRHRDVLVQAEAALAREEIVAAAAEKRAEVAAARRAAEEQAKRSEALRGLRRD